MKNKWYVYEKGWTTYLGVFDTKEEAEKFVENTKMMDRTVGWYSSEYEICEGSDAVSAWLEDNSDFLQ